MFQIRIHGRGGQGVVTAAEMLSVAAFLEGRACPGLSEFRLGAHGRAGRRLLPHRRQGDPAARADPGAGRADPAGPHPAQGRGRLRRASTGRLSAGQHDQEFRRPASPAGRRPACRRAMRSAVPATELALKHVGRPAPNAALLGAFAALSGVASPRQRHARHRTGFSRTRSARPMSPPRPRPMISCGRSKAPDNPPEQEPANAEANRRLARHGRGHRPVPARSDLRLSDHAPDPHRRRARRNGEGRRSRQLRIHQRRESNSPRCRSRSARRLPARAPIRRRRRQGLLFMAEAVYNAAGLGLPIVMTLGNRAIGAPINIWNDHSDAMSMRDAGWLQLFAETNQEAVDLHIQAFRLAEELSMPMMVCVDGFILTHAVERIDIPEQAEVDAYLPPYEPVQVLDPAGPDLDRRHGRAGSLHRGALPAALQADAGAAADSRNSPPNSARKFGRDTGGLLRTYRTEDAEHAGRRHGLGQRHHQGHHRRDARRRLQDRPGRRSCRFARSRWRRCARRWPAPARRGDREEHRRRHGRPARQ